MTRGWLMPALSLYWRRRRRPLRPIMPGRLAAVTNVFAPLTRVSVHNHLHYTQPGTAVTPARMTVFRSIRERITVWRWMKARPLDAGRTPTPIVTPAATAPARSSTPASDVAPPVPVRARRVADEMRPNRDRVRVRSRVDRESVTWRSPMRSPGMTRRDAATPNRLQANVPPGRRVDRRGADVATRSAFRMRSSATTPAASRPLTSRGQHVSPVPQRTRASADAHPSVRDSRVDRHIAGTWARVLIPWTAATTAALARRSESRSAGSAAGVPLDWRRPQAPPDRGRVEQHALIADRASASSGTPPVATAQIPQPGAPGSHTTPAVVLPLDRATIDRLADNVISRIERHIRIERERRGL